MKRLMFLPFLFAILTTVMINQSHAELIDRGGGLIYDTVLDITWMQDASYAQTSGYDADGKVTWYLATLFFKWIKQHLRIKKFFGTSENAVKTQIWIAVSN